MWVAIANKSSQIFGDFWWKIIHCFEEKVVRSISVQVLTRLRYFLLKTKSNLTSIYCKTKAKCIKNIFLYFENYSFYRSKYCDKPLKLASMHNVYVSGETR